MARATTVHRQYGVGYVAFDENDNILGRAGALSFKGTPVSLPIGHMIEFDSLDVERKDDVIKLTE